MQTQGKRKLNQQLRYDFDTDNRVTTLQHRAAALNHEAQEYEAMGEYDIAQELYAESSRLMNEASVEWRKDGRYWPDKYEAESLTE